MAAQRPQYHRRSPTFSLVVAVDARTVQQLEVTWPTWRLHKRSPLFDWPMLMICDHRACRGNARRWWERRLAFVDHPNRQLAFWSWPDSDDSAYEGVTQRERMLTALVHLPPALVETDYWCKIDTDAVAVNSTPWPLPEWFESWPALIGSPWPYTKPAHWLGLLDEWGDEVPMLAKLRRMNLPTPAPGQECIAFPRIASWCSFIRNDFAKLCVDLAPGRLPVPSQDTFHWYVAWRRHDEYLRIRPQHFGWQNRHSERGRRMLVEEVLTAAGLAKAKDDGCNCG